LFIYKILVETEEEIEITLKMFGTPTEFIFFNDFKKKNIHLFREEQLNKILTDNQI
jgi:hypothetical protein